MSRSDGHINAGRIDRSQRLQVILELLKKAAHPLSAEEIAQQAYEFSKSGKIMLNVSTNIGEMRSKENKDLGFFISMAESWKGGLYPWHDGRPRYRLIAAPGWSPRWTISDGKVLFFGGTSASRSGEERSEPPKPVETISEKTCLTCGHPMDPESKGLYHATCRPDWYSGAKPEDKKEAQAPQGRLL